MSDLRSKSEVQRELNELSPALASLRNKQFADSTAPSQDALQRLAKNALHQFEREQEQKHASSKKSTGLRVAFVRKLAVAAAIASIFITAGIAWKGNAADDQPAPAIADLNLTDDELLAASTDPLAYLFDQEVDPSYSDEELYSTTELMLFDWADDGIVENELSEKALLDAVW